MRLHEKSAGPTSCAWGWLGAWAEPVGRPHGVLGAVKGWGMPYHLRFFFDYGVDTPLWPGPQSAPDLDSPYEYPCVLEKLPITPATRDELTRLADLYQSSLDWDHPAGPSPWTRDQQESFRSEADVALEALRRELGDDWTVEDRRH